MGNLIIAKICFDTALFAQQLKEASEELSRQIKELQRDRPWDTFDRLTGRGYKLNLLTGEYSHSALVKCNVCQLEQPADSGKCDDCGFDL